MKAKQTLKGNTKITLNDEELKALKTILVFSHEIKISSDPHIQKRVADSQWVSVNLCALSALIQVGEI